MPISSHALLPWIVQALEQIKPKKILDLGIGHGIYGVLIRNYADILMGFQPKIHGVEAWESYECFMWDAYNKIYRGKLEDFEPWDKYDLIIMMDVIEHLSLKEGEIQLQRYKGHLSPGGTMIVSTPSIFVPQEPYKGNTFEVHKSLWTGSIFQSNGFTPLKSVTHSLFGEKMLIYFYKQTGG